MKIFATKTNYIKTAVAFLAVLFCLITGSKGWAQTTTVPFTTSGATTWFCPAGVTSVIVECWGGGGAGGGATSNPGAGGGGAGGAYTKATIAVSPGITYNLFVGVGGTASTGTGGAGGSSWFSTNTTLLAIGGPGGGSTSSGAAGIAPTTGNIGGTTNFYGGNGVAGTSGSRGGGGGGSAGITQDGNDASGVNGGTAVTGGGAGGNGSTGGSNGSIGSTPGGGGGGGRANGTTDRLGGAGAVGKVSLSYTTPGTYKDSWVSMNIGSTTWCAGETRTISVTVKNTGTAPWTDVASQNINIGVKWDGDPDYLVRTDVGGLAAGATGTFNFTVTAPAAGTNHLTFDVVYEGLSWFANNGGGVGPGNVVSQSAPLTIAALPGAPTGSSLQSFCTSSSPTVASLIATGTGIKWYAAASGGTALATSTPLVDGTHYYASQTNGSGCESSTRLDVTVSIAIGVPAQPSSISGNVTACSGLSQTYSVTNVPGVSYAWNIPAGWTISSGQGTNSVTYTVGASSGTIQVTPSNVCGTGISQTLGVTVIPSVSGLSYTSTPVTYCTNVAITPNTVAGITGGGTITYSVSPALPAGLTISAGTGTISGTPTTASAAANYTVTATNGCSSTTAIVNITVQTAATTLGYTAQNPVYCTNNVIATNSPTTNAGGTKTFSVSPALPNGLNLNTGTGTITGTPTTAAAAANYVITVSNGCSNTQATLNITILQNVSGLSYTSTPVTYCTNVAITPNTVAGITGGGTITYSVSPALPAGLTISAGTGTISGTPTTASAAANYTVTATNGCSSTTAIVNITVQTAATTLGYTAQNPVYCTNNVIATNSPTTNAGGTKTFSVSPALPNGLNLNTGTGTITGTPTTAAAAANYVITVSNGCSNTQATLNITILQNVSGLSYTSTPVTYCTNVAITPNTVAGITGGGTITYSVSPALPAGLTISAGTGTISGTPTTASAAANYTVTATNGCSSTTAIVNITVQTAATTLGYTAQNPVYCTNNVIATNSPTTNAGGTKTFSVSPALPNGLNLNTGTGTITGTPTTAAAAANYVITVSNGCSSKQSTLNITVITGMSGLSYVSSSVAYCTGNAITPNTVTGITGGGTISYSVSPVLPAGLGISSTTGAISGTPTTPTVATNYTVTATNGCSSTTAIVNITINALPTPTVTNNPASPVCANTNITYTTQSGQSNYIWTFSGTSGTDYILVSGGNSTSNTAIVSWITPGTKTVTVNYTNSNGCTASVATPNSVTVLAVPTGNVTVSENSGTSNNDNIICAGDAVLFTAPSGNNSYTFKVNGTIVQGPNTDNTYSTTTFANGQTVTVDVANGNNCGTTFTAPTVTVTPLPVPILTVTENSGLANDYIICPNAPVTLTATANAGSTYSFIVNGSIVSTGASNSYIVNNLTANATVAVMETNSNGCQATTANQNITVSLVPSGTLTVSPGSSFCAGTSVIFTANDGGTGSIYEFKVNGTTVQGPNSTSTYTTNSLTNGQVVTVIVTNGNGCSKTFNSIPVTVNPLPAGTLTLTENSGIANDGSICAGTPVTFNATAGFATYDFQVNGISKQNTASHTYVTSTLADNDVVTVIVKSNSNCTASFNSITITVVPSPTGTLSVSPSNTICAGDNVIFTADAGFSNYNFQVNGSTVQNGNSNTYNSNSLADNDVVSVDVTNSNSCTSTFNTITMQVNPLPTGTLAIAENAGIANDGVICTGTSVTFTAPAGFANYNFLLNGGSIQNSSTRTYITTSLNNGDKVTVAITNSGGCIGLLNEYIITVNPLPVVAPITAAPSFDVCVGNAVTLSDVTNTGGTFIWSSENTSIATVDPATGLVTGIAGGTATIDYTFTNTNGCSSTVTATVTVHALPDVEPITGNFNICTGFTSQLDDATNTGGTWIWSSSDQAVATVDASTGLVTGVTPGSATISYAFTDANGCTTIVTTDIVVADAPSVAPITTTAPSSFNVCIGSTIKLKDATPGGTWSSVDGAVATISTTGIVTGLTAGTTEIRYTITTTCSQTVYASQIVTVNASPSATISYAGSPFCTTAGPVSVTQTGTIGGTYSSAGGLSLNTADGTITPSASTPGTYTITYKVAPSGGCGVYTTTTTVTITQAPSATIAYSGSPYCSTLSTATVTRTGTAGGAYSSTLGLSIDVTTGTITPSSSTPGTYMVTYIIAASGGCAQFSTTASVTITPAPSATIIYSGSPYCSNGGTATVTRTGTTGGTYTKTGGPGTLSLNSATGDIILGTSTPGTYAVTYSVAASGGCSLYTTTTSVVITPAPGAVAGTSVATCSNNPPVNITAGSSATNYSSVVWTSSGTGTFANANSLTTATYTPSVVDIAAGNVTLTLKANGNGNCGPATSTKTLTISAPPAAFTLTPASASICQGDIQSLTATSSTTSSGMATISSGPISVAIPDATFFGLIPGTVTTNMNVSTIPVGAVVTGMSINFNVTHPYDGDLVLNVKAPNGNVLNLVNNRGGSGDNFINTTISSTGVNPINTGSAPFNSTYTADNKNNVGTPNSGNLNFPGLYSISNGTWVFGAEDDDEGDVGKITSWSITFTYTIPTSPLNVTWSPTGSLYTDPGGTVGYTGSPASTVYAKPDITTTYSATTSNAANCSTTQTVPVIVKPLPVVTITADYCARAGYVRLTATSNPAATGFTWSTGVTTAGGTTSSIDVDVAGDYDVTAFQASGCPGTATISVANELVINGDFEAGNAGFTSDYAYKADVPGLVPAGQGELYNDNANNAYSVTTSGQNVHIDFWGHDHTTGSGNFMAINGHGNTLVVWKQTVNVLPNTTYYFSAWAMSMNGVGNNAQLQFSVNGALTGTTAVLANHGESNGAADNWTRFYGTWTSGTTTTSAVIYINDLQSALTGNDFGLDDISFGTLSTFVDLVSGSGSDAQTLCVNTPIQNIVYSAGSSSTAPIVTGLPPGLSATFNGVYETISGTPTAAGNYSYTVTTTGSCQPATATGTITVQQQKITLSSGSSSPTVCVNTGVNIGYTLSGTATGATATGLPSNVSLSAPVGGVVTITGTPTIAGSYPYTITTSGTCSPVTTSGTITVTSQTIALNNSDDDNQTVCINSPIANIRYNVGGTATGASVAGLPPGVNGNYSSGIFTITGAPTSAAGSPYTYTVTTSGTCNPVRISGTITVTPGSTLTLTSDPATNPQTVCKGTAIVPVTFAVNNGTGASVTGLPAGVAGGYSGGVFTISGSPTAAPGTYIYTITASGGCAVAAGTATGSITVQAQTISLFSGSISPSVCANILMPTPIVFTIGGTATGATVTGLPAGVTGSFDGVTSKFTIGGTPTAASGSYPYTVTTSGSCASVIATGTITISAAPIGGNIASIASICSGQNGTLTLTGSTGNIIRWEFSTDGGGTWTPTTPANTTISQSFAVTMPTQYRAVVGNNCSNVTSSIATIAIHNYWTGGTSKDWNVASNWSDGLAASGSCSMYTIPAGTTFSPQLVANTSVTDITIASGAHLELNDKMLTITGSYNGIGTLTGSQKSELTVTGNAGTIHFTPNNYPTDTVNNYLKTLSVNSPTSGGATIGDSLNIAAGDSSDGYGTVTVTDGTLNGNGNLILKSNVNGTAQVGFSTGKIIGNVTVERFIPPLRAWRFLTVPFSSSSQSVHDAWQEGVNNYGLGLSFMQNPHPGFGTEITGNNYSNLGYDYNTTYNPSYKVWDSSMNAWNSLEPPTISTGITDYPAYCIFVRGSRAVDLSQATSATPDATVLRAKGILNQGGVTFSRTYKGGDGKTIFVGNPYASSINISRLINNTTGIQADKFWVWDPKAVGTNNVGAYVSYDHGVMVPNPSKSYPNPASAGIIESGQGFMVQLNSGNSTASMDFKEDDKITTENNVFGFTGKQTMQDEDITPAIYTNLMVPAGNGLYLADGVGTGFGNQFSAKVDAEDANKLWNFDENIALVRETNTLAIELRPAPVLTDTLFYRLYLRQKPYTLQVFTQNFESMPPMKAWLVDRYLNTKTEVNLGDTTLYNFTPNPDTLSYRNRFMLVFNRQFAGGAVPVTKVINQENPNITGIANSITAIEPGVSVYPNPASTKKVTLQFSGMDKGYYEITVYSPKGQKLASREINYPGGNTSFPLLLNPSWNAGVYNVEIISKDSKKTVNLKLVISR